MTPRSRRLLYDSKFELFPLHSPLLGESLLVSFPPLIDMLKFSGRAKGGITLMKMFITSDTLHGRVHSYISDGSTLADDVQGARCVRRFDDSLNSAIHITYRISLRSSSMREPRDPLLKVVLVARYAQVHSITFGVCKKVLWANGGQKSPHAWTKSPGVRSTTESRVHRCVDVCDTRAHVLPPAQRIDFRFVNDPSAGSPTETLLRLLLPLNDQHDKVSQDYPDLPAKVINSLALSV
ncbi:12180_t:CDS:2 [Acaulospora colombiana]|uniref:12180_t:CDS:1 n=1 Tax=Acaulospora colombiana TaxID=27376 RepID=A0ACA9N2T4_9GLOM|nr:12180_t:CDS:2 [Acaulospora colombiana]